MAERSGFFNAQEISTGVYDRTYNAEDFSNIFKQFFGNGIMVSEEEINSNSVYDKTACDGLKPSKVENNIQVNTGYAFINGYWYYSDEILTIPINSEGTLVLEYSSSERKISLKIITGNLQQNDDIYDISIALIQLSGTNYKVTDSRSQFITTSLRAIQNLVDNSVDKFYPVGSVYTSVNNVNPSTLFGGTWERFAAGRTLVGVDAGQTEFKTVKKEGGAKTVALTVNQIPAHNHEVTIKNYVYYVGVGNTGERAHDMNEPSTDWVTNTANTGGGQAHNNLQPYITVYFWLRTA